jgi:hypothetical protein
MDIDLGQNVAYKVKIDGKEYELREPSVKDVMHFQESMKDGEQESVSKTISFISDLGLPLEVCENLGLSKLKKLVDSLVGELNEKK